MKSISYDITPLVIKSLGSGYTHTHQTQTYTYRYLHRNNFKTPGMHLV